MPPSNTTAHFRRFRLPGGTRQLAQTMEIRDSQPETHLQVFVNPCPASEVSPGRRDLLTCTGS